VLSTRIGLHRIELINKKLVNDDFSKKKLISYLFMLKVISSENVSFQNIRIRIYSTLGFDAMKKMQIQLMSDASLPQKSLLYMLYWTQHLNRPCSFIVYSRVHLNSDEVFSKILKKPSIVQKKIQTGRLKKRSFSSSANSQYFFVKISWIGSWVYRIDCCEGH
jgi:hypothetical protein